MRRWPVMAAGIALFLLLPSQGTEIALLKPAALVYCYRSGTEIVLETDCGDKGTGATAELALEDLRAASDGVVFLDTAEALILTEKTKDTLPAWAEKLRPGVRVYLGEDGMDAQKAAAYLRVHPGGISIHRWETGGISIPKLTEEKEQYRIEE